jgi:hypothetical protein
MQYVLLIDTPRGSWESHAEEERNALYEEYVALSGRLREQGNEVRPVVMRQAEVSA